MNYQFCAGEKEIYNTYWNVFSSFGYEEAIFDEIPAQLSKHEKKFKLKDIKSGARLRRYKQR